MLHPPMSAIPGIRTFQPTLNLELDHDASTPALGQRGELRYKNVIVQGDRIVEELVRRGIPVAPHEMGIVPIKGKATGEVIRVKAGMTADDKPEQIWADVAEVEPTKGEREAATTLALHSKHKMIGEYFQSKRERMNGGSGKQSPDARTRAYMEELNVEDIDDVTSHQKSTGGLSPEIIRTIMEVARESSEINGAKLLEAVETVRRRGGSQFSSKHGPGAAPGTLAANKARWEAEHPEEAAK